MKHWKRPPSGSASAPIKSRNIVLRFYPPQSALGKYIRITRFKKHPYLNLCTYLHFLSLAANNSKKKKVYEQDENEDTPLKCPVKLYEFYLSKWYVSMLHLINEPIVNMPLHVSKSCGINFSFIFISSTLNCISSFLPAQRVSKHGMMCFTSFLRDLVYQIVLCGILQCRLDMTNCKRCCIELKW